MHDAADGATFGGIADYTSNTIRVEIIPGGDDQTWWSIKRGMVFFEETADIPDGDTVSAASLFLYFTSASNDLLDVVKLQVVAATPRTEHQLTTDDYDEFGTIVLGEISLSSIVLNSYNEIVLDPTCINKTGTTILGLRFDKDRINDSSYNVGGNGAAVAIASMDNAVPVFRPFLTTVH